MTKSNITEVDIAAVIGGIVLRGEDEIRSMKQEDLEKFWCFKYDFSNTREWNTYQFNKLLDLYRKKCRSWEEYHNGVFCVVERVRDTYLMPKIKLFLLDLEKATK